MKYLVSRYKIIICFQKYNTHIRLISEAYYIFIIPDYSIFIMHYIYDK